MHLLSGHAATVNHDYFFFSESVLIKKECVLFPWQLSSRILQMSEQTRRRARPFMLN